MRNRKSKYQRGGLTKPNIPSWMENPTDSQIRLEDVVKLNETVDKNQKKAANKQFLKKETPQVNPGKKKDNYQQYLDQLKKEQYVQNHPYTRLENGNIISIDSDRGFDGQAISPNARRFDKGLEHIMNGLDVASLVAPATPIIGKGLQKVGTFLTEETALKNAYKLNPNALKEAQEQMLVRARPIGQDPNINMAESLKARAAAGEELKWYQKNLLNPQTDPQIIAREKYFGQWFADNPSDLDFYINPGTRNFADDAQIEILKARMPKSEASKYSVKNFEDAKKLSNLHDTEFILPKDMVQQLERYSVDDLPKLKKEYNEINKPHWLKGYKEIQPPKSNFKSEIDWGKWNKEIPDNPSLLNEYNTIEQTSKTNGSWMKNADGSEFQGTPEQFIQQNSENFKKAFPDGAVQTYRGSGVHNPELINNKDFKSVFTGDENLARAYGNAYSNKNYQNYFNPNIPTGEELLLKNHPFKDLQAAKLDPKNRSLIRAYSQSEDAGVYNLYSKNTGKNLKIDAKGADWKKLPQQDNLPYLASNDDVAKYIDDNNLDQAFIKNVHDGISGDVLIAAHKKGNYLKSAVGNNGMFDMTNPNIYKALVPAISVGTYLKNNNSKQYQRGGLTMVDDEPSDNIVNEFLLRTYKNKQLPYSTYNKQPIPSQVSMYDGDIEYFGEMINPINNADYEFRKNVGKKEQNMKNTFKGNKSKFQIGGTHKDRDGIYRTEILQGPPVKFNTWGTNDMNHEQAPVANLSEFNGSNVFTDSMSQYDKTYNNDPEIQKQYDTSLLSQKEPGYRDWYANKYKQESSKIDPYFALRGVGTGLNWLATKMENSRNNQYEYNQYSTMGQIDPANIEDFQPRYNPIRLGKKGGIV
jgi:hypothetical protein